MSNLGNQYKQGLWVCVLLDVEITTRESKEK